MSYLEEDDALLRKCFQSILQHHHPELAIKIDKIYTLSSAFEETFSDSDFKSLKAFLTALSPDERILVASSFSHMLNLHTVSEEVANELTSKAARVEGVRPGGDKMTSPSTNDTMDRLKAAGVDPKTIYDTLCAQEVELVFTAHPTQARRQSILRKYARIRVLLQRLHNTRMSDLEKQETLEGIKAQIQGAWRTDEIRRTQPTPQDEMRSGLAYFRTSIFPALPVYLRRLDTSLAAMGQPPLPLSHALFKFGSWMGGDRDGNPNVTPPVTRDVVIIARLQATELYLTAMSDLMVELSVWRASAQLKEYAAELQSGYFNPSTPQAASVDDVAALRRQATNAGYEPAKEPFRVVIAHMSDRLQATKEALQWLAEHPEESVVDTLHRRDALCDVEQLLHPLMMIYESLIATKDDTVANNPVRDLIRQVQVFGLALTRLDVRQESHRHTEVMNTITQFLDLGSYSSWSEEERVQFLVAQLKGRRPLLPRDMPMNADCADVVGLFKVLAELPPDSLGAYVISMAQTASDVLAVVLLQRELGVKSFLRVAPLFETLDDLNRAPETLTTLLSNAWYAGHIDGHQECMIGYSDSGKDAGRMAAAWGLYTAQESLLKVARAHNTKLTLFHGRGGTVGRGGGPTHLSVLSQPAGTIDGNLRVTVQGEVIEQQFGEMEVSFRTLDIYTSSVMESSLQGPAEPKAEWRAIMDEMSATSCEAYRAMVHKNPRFVEYFRASTPVAELGRLNIGSRPAARKKSGGIETLRAIPWIFAWSQTRFHVPVWLGLAEALQQQVDKGGIESLHDIYKQWPFFKVTIDMIEMVMAKADPHVAHMYERELVSEELWPIGEQLQARFKEVTQLLMKVVGRSSYLTRSGSTTVLAQKLHMRAPYVTPLNVLQVECLRYLRGQGDEDEETYKRRYTYAPEDPEVLALLGRGQGTPKAGDKLMDPLRQAVEDTVLITIKGISAGMQNTG